MKYAVIRTGGKQYRVSEGDVVKIEKLDVAVGEKITLADVLFVGNDNDVKIGTPLVANATVTGEIVDPKIVFGLRQMAGEYLSMRMETLKITTDPTALKAR